MWNLLWDLFIFHILSGEAGGSPCVRLISPRYCCSHLSNKNLNKSQTITTNITPAQHHHLYEVMQGECQYLDNQPDKGPDNCSQSDWQSNCGESSCRKGHRWSEIAELQIVFQHKYNIENKLLWHTQILSRNCCTHRGLPTWPTDKYLPNELYVNLPVFETPMFQLGEVCLNILCLVVKTMNSFLPRIGFLWYYN